MHSTDMTNEHKKVVISGGLGYLGQELTKRFLEEGWSVVALYHSSPEEKRTTFLESLPEPLRTSISFVKCNLANKDEIRDVLQLLGSSTYVHAAGNSFVRGELSSMTTDEMNTQWNTNALPAFTFLTAAASLCKVEKRGIIIGVTTIGVHVPEATKHMGGYIAAKYAQHGMLIQLHEELQKVGVRVHEVAPGFMEGGLNKDIPRAFVELAIKNSKTGAITDPHDVAQKIVELCTQENSDFFIPIASEYGL